MKTDRTDDIDALRADAARYRYLREHCSSHYPMTHEQPAEWSIQWEFQQRTPVEAFGTFDFLIDQDIERQREIDAEDCEVDPENIYNLPGIRQSIEEDRKR